MAATAGAKASAAQSPVGEGAALLRADREFARAAHESGLEGWMSFFADDAVRIQWGDAAVRGLEAIRKFDARIFSNPEVSLQWEPLEAGLYRDGKLGFTRGRAEVRRRNPGAEAAVVWRGSYLTIWRMEPSGEWKVILDTGTADEDAEP